MNKQQADAPQDERLLSHSIMCIGTGDGKSVWLAILIQLLEENPLTQSTGLRSISENGEEK